MGRMLGALLAMVLVAGGLLAATEHEARTLPLPPPGQVLATFLPDGLPVFVVHRHGGAVRVLDARSPHRPAPWWHLAGWCPSSGAFEDPWHGSRFTWSGHWVGGPAPRGLTPFTARVHDGRVRVGGPAPAPARDDDDFPADGGPSGPSCLGFSAEDSLAAGMVAHDALLPERLPPVPDGLRGARGWVPVRGTVLRSETGPVRLCRSAPGTPPGCRDGLVWGAPRPVVDGLVWERGHGRLLARMDANRVRDVIALGDLAIGRRLQDVEQVEGTADVLTAGARPSLVLRDDRGERHTWELAPDVEVWRPGAADEPAARSAVDGLRERIARRGPVPVMLLIDVRRRMVTHVLDLSAHP